MRTQPIKKQPVETLNPHTRGAEGAGVTDLTQTLRKLDSAPSVANNDHGRTFRQIPVDLIEEESMESFPASDPPSHGRSHA